MAAILRLTTGVVYVRSWSGTFSGGTLAADTITLDSTNLDVSLSRGAANRLDLATGDSFALVNGNINIHKPGIAVTSTDGLILDNATAAAAGAQQMSPRLRFDGFGWKTDATAGSQAVSFINELLPVQGAAAPTANLVWKYAVNGGAYGVTPMTLSSIGVLTLAAGLITNSTVTIPSGSGLQLNNTGYIYGVTGVTGQWTLTNTAISAGVGLDVATDAVLKVRTRAQTGYATVDALGYQASGAAGVSFGPAAVASITVVNGIVTAIS